MYLENKTEISYSKNIEIQFKNMYTHFKKGMVKNMKNWRKIMAGLCVAAMVSSMVVPVWAAEETTEEAADDGDVADVSEAMLGLWKDSAGDIYGFYKDNSFFGQWKDEEQDVLGVYALSSDGEYTALAMQFANDDGTYDDENMVAYLVQANEEENLLELYDPDTEELTATLEPYEGTGDEADYNKTYQDMGDLLTECYSGETEAGETFIYAANEDGTFCSVLVIDQDDNYVSFIGEGTAYTWIVNISGLCGFIAWVGIAVSHYRFRRAFIAQGRDLSELPYKAWLFPIGPILAFILCVIIIAGQNYSAFTGDTIDWYGVSVAYIGLPIFFAVYLGYKYIKKTKLVPLKEVNLDRDFDR